MARSSPRGPATSRSTRQRGPSRLEVGPQGPKPGGDEHSEEAGCLSNVASLSASIVVSLPKTGTTPGSGPISLLAIEVDGHSIEALSRLAVAHMSRARCTEHTAQWLLWHLNDDAARRSTLPLILHRTGTTVYGIQLSNVLEVVKLFFLVAIAVMGFVALGGRSRTPSPGNFGVFDGLGTVDVTDTL
ncbi:hypothetical protein B0T24DRAFT_721036 [Lasiosphaeria ovina]|uniref:Uncharacterized protein n=1 Tax=Lasiosphaeria ovina TaxID=92902 RepID=A0AAE0K5V4_9PEZI|nr:hypothetical protein B0T24DRAFT_721036 [Lasiosphaeria ovina]